MNQFFSVSTGKAGSYAGDVAKMKEADFGEVIDVRFHRKIWVEENAKVFNDSCGSDDVIVYAEAERATFLSKVR